MSPILVAFAQAISSTPPQAIDLTTHDPCSRKTTDEIVVCGEKDRSARYRIKRTALPANEGLPSAQLKLGKGVSASAETEQADVGGFPSERVMIRIKIKF